MDIDTADSGENAVEYLSKNQPDVIFLDHMMPGIDGLDTLRTIKANPATEMIPVLMYTSKKNDDYVVLAQELGAAAVLPKEVSPNDLKQILGLMNLAGEERAATPGAGVAIEIPDDTDEIIEASGASSAAGIETTPPPAMDDIRRQLREEIHLALGDVSETLARQNMPLSNRQFYIRFVLIIGLLVALPLWYYNLYVAAQDSEQRNVQENSRLLADLTNRQAQQREINETLQNELLRLNQTAAGFTTTLAETLNWSLNTAGSYEFGSRPLAGERLATLRNLITRLNAAEFEGQIIIHVYQGRFCLQRTEFDRLVPAAGTMGLDKCDSESFFDDRNPQSSQLMSLEFADFVQAIPAITQDRISVEVVLHDRDKPVVPYPDRTDAVTAANWNRAAQRNNRIRIVLAPQRQGE